MASRIFTVPDFDRFARKAKITDEEVIGAVDRADRGLVYADLGQGVVKLAIARPNESARHGFRTIVGFRRAARAIFFTGFAKNEADNITLHALADYRLFAAKLLSISEEEMDAMLNHGDLREISRGTLMSSGKDVQL